MNAKTIQFLWRYMVYADKQMLSAAMTVPVEAWERELGISSGSVRKVMEHCIGAQVRWLARMHGPQLAVPQSLQRESAAAAWADVHAELMRFAAAQSDASVQAVVHGTDRLGNAFALPLKTCMLHVADHATYHRGQLNSLIKLAGGTPSPVMLFSFAKSQAGQTS